MPHTAKAFGVIKVKRSAYLSPNANGQRPVSSVSLTRVVQNRPNVEADETLVEIELTFPDGFFDSNTPKVQITFPPNPPMTVQAAGKVTKGMAPSAASSVVKSP